MRHLLFILGLSLSIFVSAQETPSPNMLSELAQIDSLYRELPQKDRDIISLDHKKEVYTVHHDTIEQTINFTNEASLRQYCDQTKKNYDNFNAIIRLLIKNNFLHLEQAGPGDCNDCSVEVIYEKSKQAILSYIIINTKHHCYPENCYSEVTLDKKGKKYDKSSSVKITENILSIQRPKYKWE